MNDHAVPKGGMQKILDVVERVGNQVPHPVMIFVYLIGIVVVLSAILALFGVQVSYQAYNPATHEIEPANMKRMPSMVSRLRAAVVAGSISCVAGL